MRRVAKRVAWAAVAAAVAVVAIVMWAAPWVEGPPHRESAVHEAPAVGETPPHGEAPRRRTRHETSAAEPEAEGTTAAPTRAPPPRASVAGVVRFTDSERPAYEVTVHLAVAAPVPAPIDMNWLRSVGTRVNCGPDTAYAFRFPEVTPGRYLLAVTRKQEGPVEASETVTVDGDVLDRVLTLPPLDRDRCVTVRAWAPDGTPVRSPTISVRYFIPASKTAGPGAVGATHGGKFGPLLRSDGAYDVVLPSEAHEGVRVHVETEEYGERGSAVLSGPPYEVTFHFALPARLEIRHSGSTAGAADLRRVLGATLTAAEPTGDLGFVYVHAKVGDAEVTAFEPVQPGAYRLALTVRHPQAHRGRDVSLTTVDVTLHEGLNSMDLALPTLCTLNVLGVEGTASLRSFADRHFELRQDASADGTATFRWLPAGEYMVFANGDRRRVVVPDVASIDF